MNGLNNDIPSPVEEGVVDWFKKKIGKSEDNQKVSSEEIRVFKNVASVIDIKLLNETLKKFDAVIKKVLNRPEYSQLKRGFYKVNPNDWWIGKSRYEELSTGIGFFKNNLLPNQKYWIGVYGIRYDKIFKGKEYLDLSPEAERGDTSEYGKAFWDLAKKFENDVLDTDFGKIPGFNGIDFDSINDWDDDPEVQIAIIIDPSKLVSKEAAKESTMETAQEELFPILTGKELPVREMSDGKAGALALATTIGIAGLGCGVLAVISKGIEKLFGSHKSSGSGTVSRDDIEKIKRLSQQFMDTQQINSSERRKVFGEAYGLLKKHFDPMYFKTKAIEQGTEWNDPADFYSGKINIIEFAFTQSEHQSLVGDDKIDSSLSNDEYWKEYDKLAKKWIADVTKAANAINKELSKKYNGKYRIFFEELDGGYWDYFGEGDGDEGAVVIVDVDMIDRMKSYIKNHAVEESTEIATESTATNVAKVLGWFAVLVGAAAYKRHKDNKEAYEKAKKEQEAMVKERSKEIAEYAKQTDYVAKHPVNTKERKAVLDYAYKVIGKAVDKCYISMLDTNGNWTSFTGENKDPLIPDVFCIDVCSLTPPEHLDYEYEEEWEKDVDPLVSDANKELQKKFGKKYSLVREDYMIFLIDTTYKAGLLNAVKENYTPFMDTYTAAMEGWGIAFTRFAVKHNLPFANKLEDKIWEWSESTVNQLTNIPEFKEYILREAPKAYDEAYLRNNNLSINVNAEMISEFEEEYEDSEAYHKVDKKNCCFCKKIGKFYVGVFGDKSHIHGVWLLMSDSKNKKIYAKALPAPEKELNKFKYQK